MGTGMSSVMKLPFLIVAFLLVGCSGSVAPIAGAGDPEKARDGFGAAPGVSQPRLAQARDRQNAPGGGQEGRTGRRRPGIDIPAEELERSNPILATPHSIATGRALFIQFCAACHGRTGKGDGPLAASFAIPPTDLTVEPRKYGGRDGELFWVISNGIPGTGMPPWKVILTERQSWEIINYIRSLSK